MSDEFKKAINLLDEINNLFMSHPHFNSEWITKDEYQSWSKNFENLLKQIKFFAISLKESEAKKAEQHQEDINRLREEIDNIKEEKQEAKKEINTLKEQSVEVDKEKKTLKKELELMKDYLKYQKLVKKELKEKEKRKKLIKEKEINQQFNKVLRGEYKKEFERLAEIEEEFEACFNKLDKLFTVEEKIFKTEIEAESKKIKKIKEQI